MKNKILQIPINNYNIDELVLKIEYCIKDKKQIHLTGVNASKIVDMKSDQNLERSVLQSNIIIPDGQSVIWASRILKKPLKERIAGIDLMQKIIETAYNKKYKIFFFGAKEEIVSAIVKKYTNQYNANIIAGYRNGYFKPEEEQEIVNKINKSEAEILFVAMTSPKQENFIAKYRKQLLNVFYITEVGGSFDVISGKVKRAPVWMQKNGLEWFYRFLQEPRRLWKRNLIGNFKFIIMVIKEKISL